MNPFFKFLELIPTTKKYYGTIASINIDLITVILVGGGTISFRNIAYARSFAANTKVWLENHQGTFVMTQAPTMESYVLNV